ncbi:conjugal transfer protein [Lysinibacillus macroides]|uniref:Conjugal transfer protein n=1 Tax=Lysinibacillus macroides TaxID=33935 RepID=A0A0N0CWE5_9BACI|nr:conjugal transfer protein [Lysinibacillus macroides]KOY82844.1 conjugal transfer protein [Lysinibacillus macroides]QPR66106.1 conjugal transfer protein [Lysinibacillus macroides]
MKLFNKKGQAKKSKKRKVMAIGTRKKTVLVLWLLLISSLAFGIYKNFTAIDKHTIHETKVIETSIIDTHTIESFTKNFVKDYYTWQNNKEAIAYRADKINNYLTEELQMLNADTIRADIPTSSSVEDINIWSITAEQDNHFAVVYSLKQKITEDKEIRWVQSTYRIYLYQDADGNVVLIKNPTLWDSPKKSAYIPKKPENNGSVDSNIIKEVTEFLETFFAFYPVATEKELAYYVQNNALPPIGKKYLFSTLLNPIYQQSGQQVHVWVTVKYLDEITKATQLSQYELILEKDVNWMIVK